MCMCVRTQMFHVLTPMPVKVPFPRGTEKVGEGARKRERERDRDRDGKRERRGRGIFFQYFYVNVTTLVDIL